MRLYDRESLVRSAGAASGRTGRSYVHTLESSFLRYVMLQGRGTLPVEQDSVLWKVGSGCAPELRRLRHCQG